MMDLKEVNDIRSQIGQLRTSLQNAKDRLEVAGLKALGLSVGDRIIYLDRGKDVLVEVTGCNVGYGDPRPEGCKVKKDGIAGLNGAGYIENWRHT